MTRLPRVLVIPSWYPDAERPTAGIFIERQVTALKAAGLDVAVLHVAADTSGSAPILTAEDGVTVVRAGVEGEDPRNRFFGHRRVGRAAFDMLRASWGMPDIVHVQALWPAALIARDIKRRYGVPYVVTEHSEEYLAESRRRLVRTPGMLPLVLRPLARGAARTIAVSRHLADRLEDLGLARVALVVPNVVLLAPALPRQHGLPRRIVHVSIMGPAKDLPGLIAAAARLRERRRDFVLSLVGDGECRPEVEARVASLGLTDVVEFTGTQSAEQVAGTLAGSAFTVVSSTHETFSVVAAESLMAGRPVLSTRCGGPEEFVTPEVGLLVDAGDPDALADGLDWMLDHSADFDPVTLHEYAMARFAPEVVARRLVAVYREVLDA